MSFSFCQEEELRDSMGYTELCNQYNKIYKTSQKHSQNKEEKLKPQDVAGYAKKLEKLGFVEIGQMKNSSERVVRLTAMQGYQETERRKKNALKGKEVNNHFITIDDLEFRDIDAILERKQSGKSVELQIKDAEVIRE